ncbi:hypothetical protein DKX38_011539 [Salix brachista]|uniref:Uncharacterized protein n=1 Tax=Salix brachista TaxID=2182728 RepID=A0A5N5M1P8_9ROSI|nr:hypothetical protein DKX38_011539 [Salix brachista]
MCFNIGYSFKNGKLVRFMKDTGRDDREEDRKGLLLKEIERWKKQQGLQVGNLTCGIAKEIGIASCVTWGVAYERCNKAEDKQDPEEDVSHRLVWKCIDDGKVSFTFQNRQTVF